MLARRILLSAVVTILPIPIPVLLVFFILHPIIPFHSVALLLLVMQEYCVLRDSGFHYMPSISCCLQSVSSAS